MQKLFIERYLRDLTNTLTWNSVRELITKLQQIDDDYVLNDPNFKEYNIIDIEFTRDSEGCQEIYLNMKREETDEEYNTRIEDTRKGREFYAEMLQKQEYQKYLELKEKFEKTL